MCNSKKETFTKEQEDIRLLSSLGIKTPLNKIPLEVLFYFKSIKQVNKRYKMNEIVNNFLLAGDKFMPEMHLRQPGFTYSACGPFTKNKETIETFNEMRDSQNIYQNELDKGNFQHDMTYGYSKDLATKTGSDKILSDKAFNIAKIRNMMDINAD